MAPRSIPRGTVADHPVELLAKFDQHARDALVRQRILVARLGRGQDREVFQALVADERLRELRVALHNVDEIEYDPPLGTHDEVEVAQADIEIDHHHLVAGAGQCCAECRRRGGFAHPALARCHDQNFGHHVPLSVLSVESFQDYRIRHPG